MRVQFVLFANNSSFVALQEFLFCFVLFCFAFPLFAAVLARSSIAVFLCAPPVACFCPRKEKRDFLVFVCVFL